MTWLGRIVVAHALALAACGRTSVGSDVPVVPAPPEVAAPEVEAVPAPASDVAAPEPSPGPKAQNMGWVVLAPEGGGFNVELPVEPRLEEKPVQSPNGLTTTIRQWNASDPVSGSFFVVALSPLVQQLVEFGDRELALDRTLEAVTRHGMTVERSQRITFEGFSGREALVTIRAPEGEAHGKIRLYLVGVRLYQLIGVWLDESGQTQVEKFFASLAFSEDVDALEREPVDLWRRFPAPGGTLEVELPGEPDRATHRRDTPFGKLEVGFATLLSQFPPAVYGIHALPLAGADRDATPASLYDRWQASLDDPKGKTTTKQVLGRPARQIADGQGARLAFVHEGTFYEMLFQPIVPEGTTPKATERERDRFFGSPRPLTGAPPAKE